MSKKEKTIICKQCGNVVSAKVKKCPQCGCKIQKPIYKKWWFWVIIVIILASVGSGDTKDTKNEGSKVVVETPVAQDTSAEAVGEAVTEVVSEKPSEEKPSETKPAEEKPSEPASKEPVQEEKETVSKEFQNALKKAETYATLMHMSKTAIYDQLTSEYGERFEKDAAQYAMDNLTGIDWNENALSKAENYADAMNMSKAAIYDQLISEYGERFTKEEAQYAIDHLEWDWNANALAKAKSYREMMDMSKAAIKDQLTSEYGEKFTKEQAQYAIDHLDD